jgi:hypothetical protein
LRFDLDPRHDPPAHVHRGGPNEREPFAVVSLREALTLAWEATSQAAEDVASRTTRRIA